jgi:SAM-dependent methyltransferase
VSRQVTIRGSIARCWTREREAGSRLDALGKLLGLSWDFVRESLPDRRRQRYGDVDYDWDYRVDTTSATLSWRTRLLGLLSSPYQPVSPDLFEESMAGLAIPFGEFTFIDIGSGKGRALLLASSYGFGEVIGIELLPELNRIAQENIGRFSSRSRTTPIAAHCGDATQFVVPPTPLAVFLFHSLPLPDLRKLLGNLARSLAEQPRPASIIYANPIFEEVVRGYSFFRKITGTNQYAVFCNW